MPSRSPLISISRPNKRFYLFVDLLYLFEYNETTISLIKKVIKMKVVEAIRMYKAGAIEGFTLVRKRNDLKHWLIKVEFDDSITLKETIYIETALGGIRKIKTLDAALNVVEYITGETFLELVIDSPDEQGDLFR